LKEELKIKKWTDVSKRLRLDYNIKFRTEKQCRDRYTFIYLDMRISLRSKPEIKIGPPKMMKN
jgi:hypothetical protein